MFCARHCADGVTGGSIDVWQRLAIGGWYQLAVHEEWDVRVNTSCSVPHVGARFSAHGVVGAKPAFDRWMESA